MTNRDSTCPKCKTSLGADAKFCPQCGAKVSTYTCDNCGATVPPDAKFCPGCGKGLGKTLFGKIVGANEEDFSRRREWRRTPGDFAANLRLKTSGAP